MIEAMVPVRYAAEPMGATLNWEGGSVQKATIQKGNDVVEITIGHNHCLCKWRGQNIRCTWQK